MDSEHINSDYLQNLAPEDLENDIRESYIFSQLVYEIDGSYNKNDVLDMMFREANEFSLRINRIINKYLGFDRRLANDSVFRRLDTIEFTQLRSFNSVSYDPLKDIAKGFSLPLIGEFTIDRLVPEVFEEINGIVNLDKVRSFYIKVLKINEEINNEFFKPLSKLEDIQIVIEQETKLPDGLFDNLPHLKKLLIYNGSNIIEKTF